MDNSDLKSRILDVINRKQYTSSKLAGILGVQRSSVSHILSGRNNPSLDFVVRMITKIPGLKTDWLLFGTGDMFEEEISQNDMPANLFSTSPSTNEDPDKTSVPVVAQTKSAIISGKKIAKILVFYTDSTFEEFKQS